MRGVTTIGIVGGGQLGRMLTLAAKPLGFEVVVLDPGENCPASQVGARQIIGGLYDPIALKQLAKASDVVTVEIEHLDTLTLETIAKKGKPVHPSPATIRIIQDKYHQKHLLQMAGVNVAPFIEVNNLSQGLNALTDFGGKMMLKTRHGAFDGRGNFLITSAEQLKKVMKDFQPGQLYAEKLLKFTKELSVIIAKNTKGKVVFYPVVEMVHQRSICLEVLAPANITTKEHKQALKLAKKVAKQLRGAGVFAIEMFLLDDGRVVVNEVAPRVHNSGHFSLDGSQTSQFEQHIRAITGLPLGSTEMTAPAASMVNILGTKNGEANLNFSKALSEPATHVHWYGKSPVKIDRKMGHVTSTGKTSREASKRANQARRGIKV